MTPPLPGKKLGLKWTKAPAQKLEPKFGQAFKSKSLASIGPNYIKHQSLAQALEKGSELAWRLQKLRLWYNLLANYQHLCMRSGRVVRGLACGAREPIFNLSSSQSFSSMIVLAGKKTAII